MARYRGLTLRVMGKRAPAMGPGKAELIERIAATGSIPAAARAMGMSYRRAWQLVEALNRDYRERVVDTATGGARRRGARDTLRQADLRPVSRHGGRPPRPLPPISALQSFIFHDI